MKDKIEHIENGQQRMKEDVTSMIQLLHQMTHVTDEERRSKATRSKNQLKGERIDTETSHGTQSESGNERESQSIINKAGREGDDDLSDTESSIEEVELNWKRERPHHGLNPKNVQGLKETETRKQIKGVNREIEVSNVEVMIKEL